MNLTSWFMVLECNKSTMRDRNQNFKTERVIDNYFVQCTIIYVFVCFHSIFNDSLKYWNRKLELFLQILQVSKFLISLSPISCSSMLEKHIISFGIKKQSNTFIVQVHESWYMEYIYRHLIYYVNIVVNANFAKN